MSIILPARIVLCPNCMNHGVIGFSDGSQSASFGTKKRARLLIDAALTQGVITTAEAEALRIEITRNPDILEESEEIDRSFDSLHEKFDAAVLGAKTDVPLPEMGRQLS